MSSFQSLPGFRDFYPPEFRIRSHIMNAWREVARRYGFEEYDGPPLEPLELYVEKSGEEIVRQLYNFTDKGDREVALRPEMTPTFARMVDAQADPLVFNAAALSLRANAARPAAGAFPVERGHRR
jgi:histidyl-tRNA synthetase